MRVRGGGEETGRRRSEPAFRSPPLASSLFHFIMAPPPLYDRATPYQIPSSSWAKEPLAGADSLTPAKGADLLPEEAPSSDWQLAAAPTRPSADGTFSAWGDAPPGGLATVRSAADAPPGVSPALAAVLVGLEAGECERAARHPPSFFSRFALVLQPTLSFFSLNPQLPRARRRRPPPPHRDPLHLVPDVDLSERHHTPSLFFHSHHPDPYLHPHCRAGRHRRARPGLDLLRLRPGRAAPPVPGLDRGFRPSHHASFLRQIQSGPGLAARPGRFRRRL